MIDKKRLDKELERAAEEWAECDRRERGYTHQVAGIFKIGAVNGYIAGAKSRDDEVRELKKRIRDAGKGNERSVKALNYCVDLNTKLETQVKELREALEFYAKPHDRFPNDDVSPAIEGAHDRARAVLEKWK